MSYVHHLLFVFGEFMQISAHMNQEYGKYNENELFSFQQYHVNAYYVCARAAFFTRCTSKESNFGNVNIFSLSRLLEFLFIAMSNK